MNINDYMDEIIGQAPLLTLEAVTEMFVDRSATAYGFFEREERYGIISLRSPLSDSRAQDSYRLIVYRFLEELLESYNSKDIDHVREEAIDALNYFMTIPLIEGPVHLSERGVYQFTSFQRAFIETMHDVLVEVSERIWTKDVGKPTLTKDDIGTIVLELLGDASAMLRNRAWMENTQHSLMNYRPFLGTLPTILKLILDLFPGWDSFWEYYTAKDQVLQFRLKSRY